MPMKNIYLIIIGIFLIQSSLFSQNNLEEKKDSIADFLIRGLWIEYEQQKQWSYDKDTIITYTADEYSKYYSANPIELDSIEVVYLMEDNYARKTADFFEEKTKIKRKSIHKAQSLIPILGKDIIEEWTLWYNRNKKKISLTTLRELCKH